MTINFHENNEHESAGQGRPLVSVIVLTYGNSNFIPACFEAIASQTWNPIELIYVDNASPDNSADVARETATHLNLNARFFPLDRNLGCAGGNNIGWQAATGKYIVFLNPDTEMQPACIEELIRPMEADSAIGCTGAKMYFPGGDIIQHAGGIVHPNGMTNHHGAGRHDNGEWNAVRDVDYVTGAALAMPRSLMQQLGGFDEDFFPAYFEEVDLCLRVRQSGKRVVYIPTAVLVHHESVSVGKENAFIHQLFPRMRIRYLLKNLTLRQLAGWALPFEYRWMRHEPAAHGYRWKQVRYGWLGNLGWMTRWLLRGRRRMLPPENKSP